MSEDKGDKTRHFEIGEIFSFTRPFMLSETDFLRMTKIPSYFPIWAHTISAGSVIYVLALTANAIEMNFLGTGGGTEAGDWYFVGLLAVLVLVLEFINWKLPGEKKKIEERIKKHFDSQSSEETFVERQ